MPNIKLTASVGRTINLGNYESLRLDEGVQITINTEVTNPEEKYAAMIEELENMVEKHGNMLAKKIKGRR